MTEGRVDPWFDATFAAALFAVDPAAIGGIALRALTGPVREAWLDLVRDLLPPQAPVCRLPLSITDGRLLGGLDLAATLRAGRPVAERGLLVEADGGVVLLAMAERHTAATVAKLNAVLDAGLVVLERDGLTQRNPARLGVVALDEGMAEDERPPAALLDRLAFHLDLDGIRRQEALGSAYDAEDVAAARALLPDVTASDDVIEALCGVGMALGIGSLRAPLLALRVAKAAAALAGRKTVSPEDATVAGRLVLAPRAKTLPAVDELEEAGAPDEAHSAPDVEPGDAPPPDDDGRSDDEKEPALDRPLEDQVLEAAQAAIPAGLLAALRLAEAGLARSRPPGRAGAPTYSMRRGRPAGIRKGVPKEGARLNVVETLRAAAPWQPIRRRDRGVMTAGARRIEVRLDDFRITRFLQRAQTTTIFVVDASGSSALDRLAEAKGAVELLLADCYVRRDQVALIAFRGQAAELLLPPTRSLVRAKRSLAGLPGGGGTPLAMGIDAALALAEAIRRRGETPVVILLTDGKANVARDGGGRERAGEEALLAARRMRAAGLTALLLDTSPRPQPVGERLAMEMGARYLPLPYADTAAVSAAVRMAVPPPRRAGAG